jgi:hypothetical protein
MTYTITGLDPKQFEHLRNATDDELAAQHIKRMIVDGPRFPDRITLRDLPLGASVLLLNYEHQPALTAYRSTHAIFVAEDAREAAAFHNEIPKALRDRLLSLRAFDDAGMMLDAEVVDGKNVEPVIERLFANPSVAYIHAHNAARGCYSARIDRSTV